MPAPRYILYTRVSTEGQDDNTSHETQLAALLAMVEREGGQVAATFRETSSGASFLARPKIRLALEMLEKNEADVLACYDFSRYSRDQEHQLMMARRVGRMGKRIQFATMTLEYDSSGQMTPESQLVFGVHGSFASYHRAKVRADSMRGMRGSALRGQQPNRRLAPFGYHIVQNAEVATGMYPPEMAGKYIVLEERAAIVRDIFERRARGESLADIARHLNNQQVPTSQGGGRWYPSSLTSIITNRAYYGEAEFGKKRKINDESRLEQGFRSREYKRPRAATERITIPCPAIVSRELWEQANAVALAMGRSFTGKRAYFLLTNILRCPHCSVGMTGVHEKRVKSGCAPGRRVGKGLPRQLAQKEVRSFYICRASMRKYASVAGLPYCKRKLYDAGPLEARVVQVIRDLICAPDFLASFLEPAEVTEPSAVQEIEKQLQALQERERMTIEAQIRAIGAGADSTAYETLLAKITEERRALQAELKRHSRSKPDPQLAQVVKRIEEALTLPLNGDVQTLHNLLALLIERIDFDEDKVEVEFKL